MRETTNPDDGARIAWTECGAGTPVLLIMGLGADSTAWEPHSEYLERTSRCLIVDNRGIGSSDAPAGPYSTSMMADDCAAVIRAADSGPVAVVGISLGGAIAQSLALRHPALVSRLMLTSTWARPHAYSVDTFDELKALRAQLTPSDFTRRLQLLIWSAESYAAQAATLREERRETSAFAQSSEAFASQCDACVSHDVLAALGTVSVPTLVTAGALDEFTPLSSSLEIVEAIDGAGLDVFPDGGHAHHWEDLDRYNALCEEFIHAA